MSKKKNLVSKAFGTSLIKGMFSQTVGMLKSLKSSKKDFIKETFSEAMDRLKIDKEKENEYLLNVYKKIKIQFMIILIGQIYLTIAGVIHSFYLKNYLATFTYILIVFALSTLNAQYSLRCYQIRKKHLGLLGEWFKNPKNWYPWKITKEKLESVEIEKPINKESNSD